MKKSCFLFAIIVFSLLSVFNAKAQMSTFNINDTFYLDYHNYDTLYLYQNPDLDHDPVFNVNGCFMDDQVPPPPMYNDPTNVRYSNRYQAEYANPPIYDPNDEDICLTTPPFQFGSGQFVIGFNDYRVEAFGQPFHLDDSAYIVGVASRVGGYGYIGDCWQYHFRLFTDDRFSEQVAVSVNPIYVQGGVSAPMKAWFFVSDIDKVDDKFRLKDFIITADEPTTGPANLIFPHTCSIFDTVWQDTLIGCQAQYSPYMKKDGVWKTFAEDTIYQFWQKMCIEWYPIIYSPRIESNDSGLEELTQESFSIFPNPAKEEITIESPYEIERIEISNTLGVAQKSLKVKGKKVTVTISDLEKGTYLVSIKTSEGNHTKKIVKE
ncbi:MAG: T9SS type A sorting domain-containing protein [Bacteroidales bacterium]|nr:T9SS type A sorting domain-containing protein [Bacteroidales bacterium]